MVDIVIKRNILESILKQQLGSEYITISNSAIERNSQDTENCVREIETLDLDLFMNM